MTEILLEDPEILQQFLKLSNGLEELDDVQMVHSNATFDPALLSELES